MAEKNQRGSDITDLAPSWDLSLRALQGSPNTIDAYLTSLTQFTEFLAASGLPLDVRQIERGHVEAWLADLAAQRRAPATTNKRYMALRVFWSWAVDEDEVDVPPMAKMKSRRSPNSRSRSSTTTRCVRS